MDAVKVGARIKAARKVRRLTQAVLAQEVDITPKYLSNIECGAKVPKLETFIEIANALEVDANTLLVDVLTVSSAQRSPSSLPRYLPMSGKGSSGSSML